MFILQQNNKMVTTKSKVSVKYSEENSIFGRVSYYLLLEFVWEGVGWGWGWALIQGWALINFFCFRMGAYSNKYSIRPHLLWVNALVDSIPYPQTPADSGDFTEQ